METLVFENARAGLRGERIQVTRAATSWYNVY